MTRRDEPSTLRELRGLGIASIRRTRIREPTVLRRCQISMSDRESFISKGLKILKKLA